MAKTLFLFVVCISGSLAVVNVFEYWSEQTSEDTDLRMSAPLSVCMEMSAVANKIEITESAIKRAMLKVSGFNLHAGIETDSPESCALELV